MPHAVVVQVGCSDPSETLPASAKIVVSTLAEAEFMAVGGFNDILYAVAIETSKFSRIYRLHKRIARMHALVDSVEAVDALESFLASEDSSPFRVYLKVDTGYGRCGVRPTAEEGLPAVQEHPGAQQHLQLAGIYSHSGHSYNCCSKDAEGRDIPAAKLAKTIAETEVGMLQTFAKVIFDATGHRVACVSVGSTPSASSGASYARSRGVFSGGRSAPGELCII
jgi:D-serine deaminase-like pyridoxal phosphate-dependent protein